MPLRTVGITGTGSFVPESRITNGDLERMVDTSDEWITTRTGIKERRRCREDQATSDLALGAARAALERAGLKPTDLDAIIVATVTPDMNYPSTACWLQRKLPAPGTACWDISAACSGFLFALRSARGLVASGEFDRVLVVGAECMTKFTNFEDRSSCILFGDGSGAAVVEAESGHEVLGLSTESDSVSDAAHSMILRNGGSQSPFCQEALDRLEHYQVIHGREVYRFAVTKLTEVIRAAAAAQGIEPVDFDWIIPHQANLRILQSVAERVKCPESKFYINLDKYGNTSAASIPLALDEAARDGTLQPGHLVITPAFGAGLTWGCATFRW
jgi:3-oxoacyl-[acyl-carrier-protein] synthase-3